MKQGIHPNYNTVTANCSCGASFQVGSTSGQDFSLDVCSNCHPFYTGKQKQASASTSVSALLSSAANPNGLSLSQARIVLCAKAHATAWAFCP